MPLLLLACRRAKLPPPALPLAACPSTKAQGGAADQPSGWEKGQASYTPAIPLMGGALWELGLRMATEQTRWGSAVDPLPGVEHLVVQKDH